MLYRYYTQIGKLLCCTIFAWWTFVVGFCFTTRDRGGRSGGGGNRFDLIDVTTIFRPPIAPPIPNVPHDIVEGDLFFRQGGDQLNGGRGTVDS